MTDSRGRHGKERHGMPIGGGYYVQYGNAADYLARRIARDRPDILQELWAESPELKEEAGPREHGTPGRRRGAVNAWRGGRRTC